MYDVKMHQNTFLDICRILLIDIENKMKIKVLYFREFKMFNNQYIIKEKAEQSECALRQPAGE